MARMVGGRHFVSDRANALSVLMVLLLALDSELSPFPFVLNRQSPRMNRVEAMARPRQPFLMDLELVFQIRQVGLGGAKPRNRGQHEGT